MDGVSNFSQTIFKILSICLLKGVFQKPLQMAYKRFRLQSKSGIKGCRGFYIQPGTTLVGYSIRSSLSFPTDSSTGLFSLSFQHLLVTKTAPTSGFQPPLSQQLRYTYYHFLYTMSLIPSKYFTAHLHLVGL